MKFAFTNSLSRFGVFRPFVLLCGLVTCGWSGWTMALPATPHVSIGNEDTATIHSDGTLWAWGGNQFGQVGNGTNVDAVSPVQVGADNDWSRVSAGGDHTLATKADGSLWAWGLNYSGELGDGTRTDRNAPVRVGTATNWNQVAAGGRFPLGVTQPRIFDLMRGKISLFGSEGLTAMLDRAGAKVEVVVTMARAKSSRAANTRHSRRKAVPTTTRIQPSK